MLITENYIKKKLYEVITEELGIADQVDRVSTAILYQIIDKLKECDHTELIFDGVKKGTISFKHDIHGNNALITVYHYNFRDKEVFEQHKEEIDCYDGASMKSGKMCWVNISCYSISGALQKHDAMETIQHEVEHIFQDSKGDKSVFNFNPHYSNAAQYIYSIDTIKRSLAQCVYLSFRFEQDAYTNGLYGYLKQKGNPIPNWSDIADSDAYMTLMKFENALAYIEENKDNEELINECREKYNMTPQHLINISKKSIKRLYTAFAKVLMKIRNEKINEGYARVYIQSAKYGKNIYWID